jgi:iron-sulfur cluster assembly accessory protein
MATEVIHIANDLLNFTESAGNRIKAVIEKNAKNKNLNPKDLKLRFWCKSKSGQPEYGMALDNFVSKEDTLITLENGVDVVIDKRSIPLLQGSTIDVVKIGLNEQFKIENPNFQLGGCPGCSGGACSGCG